MIDHKKQGKKNRQSGQRFELKVRKDLESKGWIVDKWSNNVEIVKSIQRNFDVLIQDAKIVPAKHKYRGPGIPMVMGTGFPDFIAFQHPDYPDYVNNLQEVIGVESKSNGFLTKEEKEKCKWYLENNIFSKILIASKGKKRGEIVYKEFKNEN